jgi:hypothetical protein
MTTMNLRHTLLLVVCSLTACAGDDNTKTLSQAVCPPPTLFDYGLCVCDDLAQVGELHVVSGPAGAGKVGVNGKTHLVALAESTGTWTSWEGFNAVGASFGESLVTHGDANFVGDVSIKGDAMIGGDLTCVGELGVTGTLGVKGDKRLLGLDHVANVGAYQAPAGPPCNCDPSTFFDVEGAVAAAHNATSGQATSATPRSTSRAATTT